MLVLSMAVVGALCAAPAAPAKTVWLCRPGLAENPCEPSLSTTVFDRYGGAGTVRSENGTPVLNPSPDATWGLHLLDVNVAQGELVSLVRSQAARYAR